jgi:hypothetical protein
MKKPGHLYQGNPAVQSLPAPALCLWWNLSSVSAGLWWTLGFPSPDYSGFGFFLIVYQQRVIFINALLTREKAYLFLQAAQ